MHAFREGDLNAYGACADDAEFLYRNVENPVGVDGSIRVQASISRITAEQSISLASANHSYIGMTGYRNFGACGNLETLHSLKFNAVWGSNPGTERVPIHSHMDATHSLTL